MSQGDLATGLQLHEEELAVYEGLGDLRSRAVTLGDIARIRVSQGDLATGLQLHEEELAVYEGLGDLRSRAVTLGDIARIRVSQGDLATGLQLHEERLSVFEGLGDLDGRANTLWSIAQIELREEKVQPAFERLTEAYEIYLQLGRLEGICFVGLDLGRLLCGGGMVKEGRVVLERSQEGFLRLGQEGRAQKVAGLLEQLPEVEEEGGAQPPDGGEDSET